MDFLTCGDQEYLVSGSDDKTSKIWDMENKICVYTLEAFQSPVISVVCQPNLQMIIAGSKDGLIYLWSTANSRISSRSPRLERIINVGYGGALSSLACLMGRVVIAKEDAVAVTILDLENANYQEGSTDYNEAQSTVYPRPGNITSKVMVAGSSELLDVYPLELHFHGEVESEDHNMRSLHLTNNTDEHVAFRVTNKSGESRWYPCFIKLPLYGTVPPGSTCRLIVAIAQDWENEEMDFDLDLVLESSISGDKHIAILEERGNCDEFFSESKELGHTVHEVAMKFVYTPTTQGEATFEPEISPRIKIISMKKFPGDLSCLHAHPTEPWIITGHWDGDVGIWNSETQELVHTFKVSEKIVMCVKFNAREQWIVAQTNDTLIHVYDCVRITQIKKVASLGAPVDNYLSYYSISMHPSKPYVLSTTMKLWEGDKGWECTRAFGHRSICQAFDPEDPNSFASGTYSPDVQVWSIDSSELNHSMSGHSESAVKCLAYFTRGDRQYLITGSEDCTAKIWDLQKKTCIHTLEGFMSPVTHVISLPGRPYLVTCSSRGTIHVWSSTDFRLKTTVNFGGEYVFGLACLMGSRRIAIGARYNVSIMDIDDEEAVGTEGQN